MGATTPIPETENQHLKIEYVKQKMAQMLDWYNDQLNNSNMICEIDNDVASLLGQFQEQGLIYQYVNSSLIKENSHNTLLVGYTIQLAPNETFIYSNIEVKLNCSIEYEITTAMASAIALEIDNAIMNNMVATAIELDDLKTTGTLVGYPHGGNNVDDLADIFDEISDEEFMDLIEVITENNEEYKKAQSDEAYKHAMGVL